MIRKTGNTDEDPQTRLALRRRMMLGVPLFFVIWFASSFGIIHLVSSFSVFDNEFGQAVEGLIVIGLLAFLIIVFFSYLDGPRKDAIIERLHYRARILDRLITESELESPFSEGISPELSPVRRARLATEKAFEWGRRAWDCRAIAIDLVENREMRLRAIGDFILATIYFARAQNRWNEVLLYLAEAQWDNEWEAVTEGQRFLDEAKSAGNACRVTAETFIDEGKKHIEERPEWRRLIDLETERRQEGKSFDWLTEKFSDDALLSQQQVWGGYYPWTGS